MACSPTTLIRHANVTASGPAGIPKASPAAPMRPVSAASRPAGMHGPGVARAWCSLLPPQAVSTRSTRVGSVQSASPAASQAPPNPTADAELEHMEFRAKWMLDGACSMQEVVQQLGKQQEWFRQLEADGWLLREPGVLHDTGHLQRPHRAEDALPSFTTSAQFTVQELPGSSSPGDSSGPPSSPDPSLEPSQTSMGPGQAAAGAAAAEVELSEVEVDYRSASDGEDGFETQPIYARNMLDGCESLGEIRDRLDEYREWFQALEQEGWQVGQPVADDHGCMVRPKPAAL